MASKKIEPGQKGYVEFKRTEWNARGYSDPLSVLVIEYWGDGDPAFGGYADDRALGPGGEILTHQRRIEGVRPIEFATLEDAHEACKAIMNRRQDSLLGIAPKW